MARSRQAMRGQRRNRQSPEDGLIYFGLRHDVDGEIGISGKVTDIIRYAGCLRGQRRVKG